MINDVPTVNELREEILRDGCLSRDSSIVLLYAFMVMSKFHSDAIDDLIFAKRRPVTLSDPDAVQEQFLQLGDALRNGELQPNSYLY